MTDKEFLESCDDAYSSEEADWGLVRAVVLVARVLREATQPQVRIDTDKRRQIATEPWEVERLPETLGKGARWVCRSGRLTCVIEHTSPRAAENHAGKMNRKGT